MPTQSNTTKSSNKIQADNISYITPSSATVNSHKKSTCCFDHLSVLSQQIIITRRNFVHGFCKTTKPNKNSTMYETTRIQYNTCIIWETVISHPAAVIQSYKGDRQDQWQESVPFRTSHALKNWNKHTSSLFKNPWNH